MNSAIVFLISLAAGSSQEGVVQTKAPAPAKSVCITCHLDSGEDRLMAPVEAFLVKEEDRPVDVHERAGISCNDCHGGDPTNEETAKNVDKGYIGKPAPKIIPELCSRCHSDIERMKQFNPQIPTDQHRLYETSVHGKKLKEGDSKVATCISCHGAHGIRPAKSPSSPVFPTNIPNTCGRCHADAEYMKDYKIPTNQLENYKTSKHGKLVLENGDISAPVCNTCHGNHGASPPGVAAVHHICGNCHAQQDEFFGKNTHAKVFQEKKLPGCVVCHGNHAIPTPTDAMMSNEPSSVCTRCHQVNDPCYQAVGRMNLKMSTLEASLSQTQGLLDRAEKLGMGVDKPKFSLNEVSDHFTRARVQVHQFKSSIVEEELGKGKEIVDAAFKKGEEALEEWQFRRMGLGVSLVLILLTIFALVLKIRSLESPE